MRLWRHFVFIALLCSASFSQTPLNRDWEKEFRALPDPKLMREYMQRLSARPHHLGSPYGKDNAEWLLAKFKEWGVEAQIETFHVLFPSPQERVVEMLAPTKFVAKLQEPALAEDPSSNQLSEQLPSYNAYSIDGDVTAPLVYVNYGIPSDYEELERLGISVKGCIVIARYGASWRGIKPKVAAEHGAVGCIIYSDPIDDGYYEGEVYPKGPYRPSTGVQRGSVMDMPTYPGDPLTPGVGATANAKRMERKDVKTFTTIPVLPISYGDAQPLLAALVGRVAPEGWRGALPITYRTGPGPVKVRLKLQFHWDLKPIYNVIVKIPGAVYSDEWIMRGNHHDAWVNGAEDPISGMVALMEEVRAFSVLLKQGWKPKRTLIYCAWDAEEQGLLGSTEWAETHAEELRQKAVVYINTDGNGRGYLYSPGSHSLEKFINNVAKDIEDPETKLTVWKRSQLRGIADAKAPEARKELRSRPDLRIGALGSGSDYTAFLDHLGIASMHLGYGGEGGGGIYHSVYDSFHWFTNFSDTNFVYGRALAQTAGTAAMRFAESDLLPYDFSNLAETINKYLDELKKLANSKREEILERNKQIEEGVFAAINDPRAPRISPKTEEVPPYLNFAPLENASAALTQSAERYSTALQKFRETGKPAPLGLNKKLLQAEQKLTANEGLPNRPWFKHQIYAPGYYTGYGVKTIPAVREAIEQKQWPQVEPQIVRVSSVLLGMAEYINAITKELERAAQ
ncbi:M28 family peptidase [candidate division KSB1 bacterium]|nr:M28 family peptidase [candidate division KSB1 bacterium]